MPSLPVSDEAHDSAGFLGRLPDGYPLVVAPADGSRLGQMLLRLTAALDAAATERPYRMSVRIDLIDLVPRLRRYAALTADPVEADDLVQATLLRAWERRESLPSGPALAAWLFAALRRTYLDERRRGSAERSPQADHAMRVEADAPERRAVREAVDRLTRTQREALLLVTIEGLSPDAAAAILDCPVETVRERIDQAHDQLARDLGPM